MAREHDKSKRWRPWRFSLRTLAIVMTLACAYMACWWPTKTRGASDVDARLTSDSYPATSKSLAIYPLIIEREEFDRRCYYFWFFGFVAKLPFERDDSRFIFGRDGGVI